jgi:hypothetical protein
MQELGGEQIKEIKQFVAEENFRNGGRRYEPDLSIFCSKGDVKDVVAVEFKKNRAGFNEKNTSFTEISRNLNIICKSIADINVLYGYIIVKFDKNFQNIIEIQPGVKKIFDADKNPMYYIYNDNLCDKKGNKKDAHIYILDFDEASANRTKQFAVSKK